MDGADVDELDARGLATARRLLHHATRVVVLTGAGISTDSGIPDFRGPNGVWTRNPAAERLATIDAYVNDPDVRRQAWRSRVDSPTWKALPNRGHRALVDLERQGRLHVLVTQNIDGLHQAAGNDPTKIVEIHGTMRDVVCLACGDRNPAGPTLQRVRDGEDDPRCLRPTPGARTDGATPGATACGGILKSATISFGQNLVPADLDRAEAAAEACDLLLAVGTTLGVYPAAGMVPLAARHGAAIVIVNAEPTPFDDIAAAVLRGSISDELPRPSCNTVQLGIASSWNPDPRRSVDWAVAFAAAATTRLNAPKALAACWRLDRVRDTILVYMYEAHTVGEGPRRVGGGGGRWRVLLDPDGQPSCLSPRPAAAPLRPS